MSKKCFNFNEREKDESARVRKTVSISSLLVFLVDTVVNNERRFGFVAFIQIIFCFRSPRRYFTSRVHGCGSLQNAELICMVKYRKCVS